MRMLSFIVVALAALPAHASDNIWLQNFRVWVPETREWREARGRASITFLRDGRVIDYRETALRESRMELRVPRLPAACTALMCIWSPDDEFAPYAQAYEFSKHRPDDPSDPVWVLDHRQITVPLYPVHWRATTVPPRGGALVQKAKTALQSPAPVGVVWNWLSFFAAARTVQHVGFGWLHRDVVNTYAPLGEAGIAGIQVLLDAPTDRFLLYPGMSDAGPAGPFFMGALDRFESVRWEVRNLETGDRVASGNYQAQVPIVIEDTTDATRYALLYFGVEADGSYQDMDCAPVRDDKQPDCQCDAEEECYWDVVVLASFCEGTPGQEPAPAPDAGQTAFSFSWCYAFTEEEETSTEISGEGTVQLPLAWKSEVKLGGKRITTTRESETETFCADSTLSPGWSVCLFAKVTQCNYSCNMCFYSPYNYGPLGCNSCGLNLPGWTSWWFQEGEPDSTPQAFPRSVRCSDFNSMTPSGEGNGRLFTTDCEE